MRVPSSAPQPAAAPLHPPHPSPYTRPPSSGSRASLFVFRDPVLTHLRHSTLPGSPAATVSGRGRCALPSASSPLPSSPQAACTAAPRASGQCPAPPSTDPPPKAEERQLPPPLLRTGQFAPLTRRTFSLFGLCYYYCRHLRRYFVNNTSILSVIFTFLCVLRFRIFRSAIFFI